MKTIKWIWLLPALLVPLPRAPAQDFSGIIGSLTEMAGEYEIDPRLLQAMPAAQDWQQFWKIANETLQSYSLEDLAAFLPYARLGLAYLDRVPEARPYADWLRQRMDYFDMADQVVKEEKAARPPSPTQPPPPPPSQPTKIVPPPKKPETAPPAPPPKTPAATAATKKSMDMDRWVKRLESRPPPKGASQYVPLLKPVFKQEGVPTELVWLAEVESSFDPQAKSPVGALGLYQFMPATAERFGLSLRPKDERMVPERSALAAAKYLKFLHGRFQSWPLALAAYNAGEGRVGKLLTRHEANSFEEIAEHLPAETRMYVPKMAAVVRVREGADLNRL